MGQKGKYKSPILDWGHKNNSWIMKQSALCFSTIRSIHLWSFKSTAWIVLDLCVRQENASGRTEGQTKKQVYCSHFSGSIKSGFRGPLLQKRGPYTLLPPHITLIIKSRKYCIKITLSINVNICSINWSCLRSSPCLNIVIYPLSSVVLKESLHGIRLLCNI